MNSDPREVKAQRSLAEQIEQLKALRTSNVRDTEFKQWRQTTLTIIQRIWVGDSKRSARFRRIPFSPPSSQATLREAREYYERGCAEAAQLLKSFLDEIAENGLPTAMAQARPASLSDNLAEDDFPTVELPGGPPKVEPVKPEPAGQQTSEQDAAAGGVSVRGSGSRKDEGNGNGNAKRGERRKRQSKNAPRRRLRDMLGLDALEKLGRGDAPAAPRMPGIEGTPPPEVRDESHRRDARSAASGKHDVPKHEPPRDEAPEETAQDTAPVAGADEEVPQTGHRAAHDDVSETVIPDTAEPVLLDDDRPEPAEDEDVPVAVAAEQDDEPASDDDRSEAPVPDDEWSDGADAEEPAEVPFTADEFLSASPIFHAEGKPVRRSKPQAPPVPIDTDFTPSPLTSGTAIAVAAIASEVARLGVPDGHRARTRATLINLAQMVEDGTMDWDSLRNALAFAMEFPPIGRRLVPLLVPFLDRAA